MFSVVIGMLIFCAALYAVLPFDWSLGWTEEFMIALKGGLPIFAFLIGVLSVTIGLADIIDRHHTKKEVELQEEFEQQNDNKNTNTE